MDVRVSSDKGVVVVKRARNLQYLLHEGEHVGPKIPKIVTVTRHELDTLPRVDLRTILKTSSLF